jgi:putative transposase
MMYIRYPLSLRQVEDILFERGIDICHETVRYWWNRFGPTFAAAIRKRRIHHRLFSQWRWHLDEVFVQINGETHYLWRAVDHEGEVLEIFATKRRDRRAALKFLKRTMKRYGRPRSIVTDRLRSYGAAMRAIGIVERQECGRWFNNRAENVNSGRTYGLPRGFRMDVLLHQRRRRAHRGRGRRPLYAARRQDRRETGAAQGSAAAKILTTHLLRLAA